MSNQRAFIQLGPKIKRKRSQQRTDEERATHGTCMDSDGFSQEHVLQTNFTGSLIRFVVEEGRQSFL